MCEVLREVSSGASGRFLVQMGEEGAPIGCEVESLQYIGGRDPEQALPDEGTRLPTSCTHSSVLLLLPLLSHYLPPGRWIKMHPAEDVETALRRGLLGTYHHAMSSLPPVAARQPKQALKPLPMNLAADNIVTPKGASASGQVYLSMDEPCPSQACSGNSTACDGPPSPLPGAAPGRSIETEDKPSAELGSKKLCGVQCPAWLDIGNMLRCSMLRCSMLRCNMLRCSMVGRVARHEGPQVLPWRRPLCVPLCRCCCTQCPPLVPPLVQPL